jgi:hypothetical protein
VKIHEFSGFSPSASLFVRAGRSAAAIRDAQDHVTVAAQMSVAAQDHVTVALQPLRGRQDIRCEGRGKGDGTIKALSHGLG